MNNIEEMEFEKEAYKNNIKQNNNFNNNVFIWKFMQYSINQHKNAIDQIAKLEEEKKELDERIAELEQWRRSGHKR